MSDHQPDHNPNDGFPRDIPIIHGPITPAEKSAEEERERREANEASEKAFKERQIRATEAANKLSFRSLILTGVTAVIATLACVGTWYQGSLNRKSWETAQQTLQQMKTDAAESSRQFQAQLGHFDAGLGRTGLLAIHAGEQANETRSLAQTSKNALVSVQRAFVFPSATFTPIYISGNSGH